MSPITVLATDYDRTLTDEGLVLDPATLDALRDARAEGLRIVVVSGRDVAFLCARVGHVANWIVAENGAFLVRDGSEPEPLFSSFPGPERIDSLGFPIEVAEASASADIAHEEALEEAIAQGGFDVRLERNRDRIMVLPAGVDKGAALSAALARMNASPAECAAIGDGENDLALLAAAGHRIAVANAVDALKAMADEVTSAPGGEGVREWLFERWRPSRDAAPPPRAAAPPG